MPYCVEYTSHVSITSVWYHGRWHLLISQRLTVTSYQTLYNCSLSAIGAYWHCKVTTHQCRVTAVGTYRPCKVTVWITALTSNGKLYSCATIIQSYDSCTVKQKIRYLHTADSQDNILPRGGPIQNPFIPSLGSSIHTVQKLYSDRVIQWKGYIQRQYYTMKEVT